MHLDPELEVIVSVLECDNVLLKTVTITDKEQGVMGKPTSPQSMVIVNLHMYVLSSFSKHLQIKDWSIKCYRI